MVTIILQVHFFFAIGLSNDLSVAVAVYRNDEDTL